MAITEHEPIVEAEVTPLERPARPLPPLSETTPDRSTNRWYKTRAAKIGIPVVSTIAAVSGFIGMNQANRQGEAMVDALRGDDSGQELGAPESTPGSTVETATSVLATPAVEAAENEGPLQSLPESNVSASLLPESYFSLDQAIKDEIAQTIANNQPERRAQTTHEERNLGNWNGGAILEVEDVNGNYVAIRFENPIFFTQGTVVYIAAPDPVSGKFISYEIGQTTGEADGDAKFNDNFYRLSLYNRTDDPNSGQFGSIKPTEIQNGALFSLDNIAHALRDTTVYRTTFARLYSGIEPALTNLDVIQLYQDEANRAQMTADSQAYRATAANS